ncbi:beta-glucosidase-like glycosyl hydrolase [Cyanobium sp. Copco_Reservoir_LC18]|uniref:glycoside hydrolase family 3 N-terminal domain-containing protein n=1 Tax=Cyanobium sp. Copco_Reservoir_LC18 TaxID=1328305 RepID=UPI00135B43F0|nr:glycoside hydrolase family 3 N-terminal domain-containing protein [Cyanobium sp. Copco_Reservoir_LC18]KAF0655135.1 beta-glucosidase-like glycosyl hydrolase [Cyanobium sp. Copco_Reservoir_LC18]
MADLPDSPQAPLPPEALDRLAAELLVVRCSGHPADGQRRYPRWELDNASLRRLLERGVGGVILLGGSAAELRLRTRQLEAWAGAPLLLCADVEEGVGQRFEGASWLVPPLALARIHAEDPALAVDLARRYGACTGREARQLGLNWVLAPVCDVNNNPANPVINVRAWGEDPATAGALAAAFCRGVQAEGVLACAKHFPGHGDTASDSHLELPLIPHGRGRLEAVELPPFRQAIAAEVAAVMTGHLLLPAFDPHHPATLSRAVLTGLLRQELGFGGLVVTDALVMEAIAGRYGASEAAVLALEAGADLGLMPGDADGAIDAIVAAVAGGRLSLEQLQASQRRRRRALGRCLADPDVDPLAPLGGLSNGPAPADRALALELVRRSLVVRGRGPVPGGPGVNLIRLDNSLACPFLPAGAPALALPAAAGWRTCLIDGQGPSPWSGDGEAPLALGRLGEGPVLLQLFVRGNPFRGRADGPDPWPAVIRQLQAAGRLAGLAVYGSPYAWESLVSLLDPAVPAAWSPGQMALAQGELLGRLGFGSQGSATPAASASTTASAAAAVDFTD